MYKKNLHRRSDDFTSQELKVDLKGTAWRDLTRVKSISVKKYVPLDLIIFQSPSV
jgi:hypothetical protein